MSWNLWFEHAAWSNGCRGKKGFGLIEAKLQHHIEHEDRRVKELTEAILYDFVPSAMDVMLVPTDDPASELHVDRCRVSVPRNVLGFHERRCDVLEVDEGCPGVECTGICIRRDRNSPKCKDSIRALQCIS